MQSDNRVAIMGLGYVGLTLAVGLSRRGFRVVGVEIQSDIMKQLVEGKPHFREVGLSALLEHEQLAGRLSIHGELPEASLDAYVISVGTPLREGSKTPNIDHIRGVLAEVGRHMGEGSLVVLRSTVPVGLSSTFAIPLLQEQSGLDPGDGFSFAFAPERTAEGRALQELETLPQIVGGFDEQSITRVTNLFMRLTPTVIRVSSLEAAEMVKLIDNSYRDVHFAYSNEIAVISEQLGLDADELIKAANVHYPRNRIAKASPGVGGACLSKDPHILADVSGQAGHPAGLIRQARAVNESYPERIVDRVERKLIELGKDLSSARVLIAGFAFKGDPETSDLRNSTTLDLLERLRTRAPQCVVYGHDPVVSETEIAQLGVHACARIEDAIRGCDIALFMNDHHSYRDLDPFAAIAEMNKPAVFFDAWRLFPKEIFEYQDGIHYMGVGV